jgi:hypothetical protein
VLAKAATRARAGQCPACCQDKQAHPWLGCMQAWSATRLEQRRSTGHNQNIQKQNIIYNSQQVNTAKHCEVQAPVLSIPATLWRVVHTAVSATPLRTSLSAVRRARRAKMVNRMSAAGSHCCWDRARPRRRRQPQRLARQPGPGSAPLQSSTKALLSRSPADNRRSWSQTPTKLELASPQGSACRAAQRNQGLDRQGSKELARRCLGGSQVGGWEAAGQRADAPAAVARTQHSSRAVAKRLPAMTRLARAQLGEFQTGRSGRTEDAVDSRPCREACQWQPQACMTAIQLRKTAQLAPRADVAHCKNGCSTELGCDL